MSRFTPLSVKELIHPRALRRFCPGLYPVEEARRLVISGLVLEVNVDAPSLPVGERVKVWIGHDGQFYCQPEAQLYADAKARLKHEPDQRERHHQDSERRAQAAARNRALNIPVSWRPEVKLVLSGLSENSFGSGRYRDSVTHVWLMEALNQGRLTREAGSFLCAPAKGRIRHISALEASNYPIEVTCKRCLAIAQRWADNT